MPRTAENLSLIPNVVAESQSLTWRKTMKWDQLKVCQPTKTTNAGVVPQNLRIAEQHGKEQGTYATLQ